jgi:homoserine O-acetyltransferase
MRVLKLSAVVLALALAPQSPSASAQANPRAAANLFPGQTDGDFIAKDFHFNSGEVLPELRLHYVTLGTPHRNSSGEIDNAVLLLHSTGSDTTELLGPSFSGPLYGPGQPFDLTKFFVIIPDAIGHGKSSNDSDNNKKAARCGPPSGLNC